MAFSPRWLAPFAGVTMACTVFNGKSLPVGADASAGGDAGATCGCAYAPNAVACDDFEPGPGVSVPGAQWTAMGQAPMPDSTHVYCGKGALLVTSPHLNAGDSYTSALQETKSLAFTTLQSGFFLRAWVYATSTVNAGDAGLNYTSILETRQASSPNLGTAAQLFSSSVALVDWVVSTDTKFQASSGPLPLDQWNCVEWQVTFDATNGSAQLWFNGDGAAPPDVTLVGANTKPIPEHLDALAIGLFFDAPVDQPPFAVGFDDVIVAASRIGCSN